MDPYDRMLAAGPPEPPTADVTVEYTVWVTPGHLGSLQEVLGGEAHYVNTPALEGLREVNGSTLVPGVESYEGAEEIVQNLIATHLRNFVDVDNIIVAAEPLEDDEPDWDAAAKDRRIEEDWT